VFNEIYRKRRWATDESISGLGAELRNTEVLRRELPRILSQIDAKVMVDAACGDFNWMSTIRLDLEKYYGIDIVPELVAENQRRHGAGRREFLCLDITTAELPRADLILCRDCLGYLPTAQVGKCLQNFLRSGSRYLLTTTFPGVIVNRETVVGAWRPLNFLRPPFNFPDPIEAIDEAYVDRYGTKTDKAVGLWKLDDLPPARR